jgi:polysaccharide export outer membrane protein
MDRPRTALWCLLALGGATAMVVGCGGSRKTSARRVVMGADMAKQQQATLLVASMKPKQDVTGSKPAASTPTPAASAPAPATLALVTPAAVASTAPPSPSVTTIAPAPLPQTPAASVAAAAVASAHVSTPAPAPVLPVAVSAPAAPSASASTATPAPTPAPVPRVPESTSTAPELYTIQPEDELQISVYQEPDLTTRTRVSSTYEIVMPLLGRVSVAGLTVTQVQDRLTQLLGADFLVNPQVQVSVESYHARNVFVTGAVKRPGSYPIPIERPTTVMEILSMAGGFVDGAAVNSTRIIRNERGVERTIEVRAGDIVKKGDKAQDVDVRANDIIFVPESFF